jgi:hypothetical protein
VNGRCACQGLLGDSSRASTVAVTESEHEASACVLPILVRVRQLTSAGALRDMRGPGVSCEDRGTKQSRSLTAALPEQERESTGPVELTPEGDVMHVQFITSVAVITPDPSVSRRLYMDAIPPATL